MADVEQEARDLLQDLTDGGVVTGLRFGETGYGGQITDTLNVYVRCSPDELQFVKQDIIARLSGVNAAVAVIGDDESPAAG